ncbi:hypothetical protein M405DRAFT_867244 [Rhizopogon salebrosus TDB-379]|nr:hypothetical protein M405DRAFT_867244 [Rhizopogon salebrosus TDB-379]
MTVLWAYGKLATDSSRGTADETIVAEQVSEPEPSEIEKRGPGCPPKLKEGPPPPRFSQYRIPKLSNDKPFDTLKAQVLKRISEALKPKKLAYNDYRITFTVARRQTSSLSLKKESEYEHLLECVLKTKAPAVRILIEASRKPGTTTVLITTCIYALCV